MLVSVLFLSENSTTSLGVGKGFFSSPVPIDEGREGGNSVGLKAGTMEESCLLVCFL